MAESSETRSLFITGLRDAHALENQALSLMNRQIERIEQYPEVAARMRAHVEETNGQIGRLEQILSSLDESHSSIKDMGASFMGNMAALGHSVTGDEILKNSFANFAFENFEAASYKSLITMAEAGGFRDSIPLLQQSLREEQSMAQWLDEHLSEVTTRYMQLYASGAQASH
ncbi:MAG TPA: ferritin-like domain-containing protein [Geminicoccus sp.]|jgi:ferritin-like metal-binding protein YciE|uniref:ferritin-like domain-containing protein n=1 Tax=Geminicoccus sp. TaxID=2024832 RepID=UPI002E356B10|nr:ferritin-like domain-containing protein [Geminicoccus sp.]HEX2526865.1 ferritin-like domain-containing protein [Geminicoccus sp.]